MERTKTNLNRDKPLKDIPCGVAPLGGGNYYRSSPFFFNREGASLDLVGAYQGASAFLIGGGPSFMNIDKAKLGRAWTMTLNNAIASYRSDANCTVDHPSRFNYSMWLDPKIQKFIPFGSFEANLWDNRLLKTAEGTQIQNWCDASQKVGDCPNVVGFRRNRDFNATSFLYENAISMGCSKTKGGGRSVMLVALRILFLLGFRNVYLLGVDFEMTPDMRYHFPEERSMNAVRGNMATYAKMHVRLRDLQPHFLAEKFIVKNCNPTSKLEAFPHVSFDEAIQEATGPLGDYSSERTIGMYKPKKDLMEGPNVSTSY